MSWLGRILDGGRRERRSRDAADPVAFNDDVLGASASGPDESHEDFSPMWTDSHCHLQSLSVDDLSQTLDRARDGGVRRMVIVGTDEESSRRASAMAVDLSGTGGPPVEMWATVGLHPHDASEGVEGVNRYLGELSASGMSASRVVAVGECGLDYFYEYSPRDAQREHHRLGARRGESNLLGRRHQRHDLLGPFDLERMGRSVVRPAGDLLLDRRHDGRVRMPEEQSAVTHRVVDQLGAVDEPLP